MPARPSNAAQAATDDARFDSFAVRWLTGGKRRGAGGKAQKASEMTSRRSNARRVGSCWAGRGYGSRFGSGSARRLF